VQPTHQPTRSLPVPPGGRFHNNNNNNNQRKKNTIITSASRWCYELTRRAAFAVGPSTTTGATSHPLYIWQHGVHHLVRGPHVTSKCNLLCEMPPLPSPHLWLRGLCVGTERGRPIRGPDLLRHLQTFEASGSHGLCFNLSHLEVDERSLLVSCGRRCRSCARNRTPKGRQVN
jgi:hypothetical protein